MYRGIVWEVLPYRDYSDQIIANSLGCSRELVRLRRCGAGIVTRWNRLLEAQLLDDWVRKALSEFRTPQPSQRLLERLNEDIEVGYRRVMRSLKRLLRQGVVCRLGPIWAPTYAVVQG